MCNPCHMQPHCLHQQGLLRHVGHPVESIVVAGRECKDRDSLHSGVHVACGEQSSPSVRVQPLRGASVACDWLPVWLPFPFSPFFLPGAGILDGVHCVLNLALKSLEQNFWLWQGGWGDLSTGEGESPHPPLSIWKPQRLPGCTGCGVHSLQRWFLGSRWALPFWNAPTAPWSPACLGSLAPTVQCCQGSGVS